MPMVDLLGHYRLHTNVEDMAQGRIANGFGVAGLADTEDPRESGKVLPMTRGSTGFFYQEGSGERRQLAEDAHFRGHWGVDRTGGYRPGIERRGWLSGLGAPVPWWVQLGCQRWGYDAQGNPYCEHPMGGLPEPYVPSSGYNAPPTVGPTQPNQSVPPRTPLTPLPTGTGSSGGNVFPPHVPAGVAPGLLLPQVGPVKCPDPCPPPPFSPPGGCPQTPIPLGCPDPSGWAYGITPPGPFFLPGPISCSDPTPGCVPEKCPDPCVPTPHPENVPATPPTWWSDFERRMGVSEADIAKDWETMRYAPQPCPAIMPPMGCPDPSGYAHGITPGFRWDTSPTPQPTPTPQDNTWMIYLALGIGAVLLISGGGD